MIMKVSANMVEISRLGRKEKVVKDKLVAAIDETPPVMRKQQDEEDKKEGMRLLNMGLSTNHSHDMSILTLYSFL